MTPALAPQSRRALAVAILLGLLAGVALIVWLPLHYIATQDAALQRVEQRIGALEDRMAIRERLLAEKRVLAHAAGLDNAVLTSATPAMAAADLQGLLTQLIRVDDGQVQSVEILDPRQADPFIEVGMRLRTSMTLTSLTHLLYSIETSRPVMLVRALSIQAEAQRPSPTSGKEPKVAVLLQISSYMRHPPQRQTPSAKPPGNG